MFASDGRPTGETQDDGTELDLPGSRHDLTTNVAEFCGLLRRDYSFAIGAGEAIDALRALEVLGVADERRVRSGLRLVCCTTREQSVIFDRAFDAFFRSARRGIEQPLHSARRTRAGSGPAPPAQSSPVMQSKNASEADPSGSDAPPTQRRAMLDEASDAGAWQALRARYSPVAAAAPPPDLSAPPPRPMLVAASRFIASVRLGRSRRWQRSARGARLDLRRTIRANLQTGGDPIDLRFLAHPLRRPRFIVLIDGSRSMSEQTVATIEFARALCERSSRTSVFFFSSQLREVTEHLRAPCARPQSLEDLGPAWGGGTRIGASLQTFVTRHGARLLSADSLVIIFSDGLDAGDLSILTAALAAIDRHCAGIVWLNPHAALPGYQPTAQAMRAALPFLTMLTAANDAPGFERLAQRLAQHSRLRRR